VPYVWDLEVQAVAALWVNMANKWLVIQCKTALQQSALLFRGLPFNVLGVCEVAQRSGAIWV